MAYETGLLSSSRLIVVFPGVVGIVVAVAMTGLAPGSAAAAIAIAIGLAAVSLRLAAAHAASRLAIDGNELTCRFFLGRPQSVGLWLVRSVTVRPSKASLGLAPALVIDGTDGRRVTVRLGWWRHESEFLGALAERLRDGVEIDAGTRHLLTTRPSGESWNVGSGRRPMRQRVGDPIGPNRSAVRVGLAVVAVVVGLVVFDVAARVGETVLFPRQIDSAWVPDRGYLPFSLAGDSAPGNIVSDGSRVWVAARQGREFSCCEIAVARREAGGPWLGPALASGDTDAVRHALAISPDGTLVVAYVAPSPDMGGHVIVVRTSRDGGIKWTIDQTVIPGRRGPIGQPMLLITSSARLVGYTMADHGELYVQVLGEPGQPAGEPSLIGLADRPLYVGESLVDARVSLAGTGEAVVAAWVDRGDRLATAFSVDGGRSWAASAELDQTLSTGAPRLATDGSTILLAATDRGSGQWAIRPSIRIRRSTDGGRTFNHGETVGGDAKPRWLDIVWSDGRWRLAFEGCPGLFRCATGRRIWYMDSITGTDWPAPVVISEPGEVYLTGVATSGPEVIVVWRQEIAGKRDGIVGAIRH